MQYHCIIYIFINHYIIIRILNILQTFALTKLGWEKDYAIDKFLPLLTRWHLMHDDIFQANILMTKIIKKRINKGIKCFEIKWNNYEITTIEPQTAVQIRYPKEVSIYEDIHTKTSKKTKKKSNSYFMNLYKYFRSFA